jgi:hypothetical protein
MELGSTRTGNFMCWRAVPADFRGFPLFRVVFNTTIRENRGNGLESKIYKCNTRGVGQGLYLDIRWVLFCQYEFELKFKLK